MLKRNTAIFTVIIFIITMLPLSYVQKVYAYTNSSYFNDLKIGLVSMSGANVTLTLNGDYTINGQAYLTGTVLNLGVNGTSITWNGTLQSQINLIPNSKTNLLTITAGTITNKYMGSFLIKVYNGKVLAINTLDMENYLKGVVGYEMSDSFPLEALKAQAVAARNYALSRIGYEAAKGYDFDDTTNYQVYKGYNANYTRVISAVDQTKGEVLLYNDKLVEALYSAWHGGISENSENVWGNYVPYLRSVQDTYESDPWPNGNRVFTNAQIQSTLITKGYLASTDTFAKLDLGSITNFASGRVASITIVYKNSTGLDQTKTVTKDNTRTFLSLPSNLYTVTYDAVNGAYTFTGKGNGHGLGMSQIGAKNRAAAGQTYDQILKFYYQNTYLQNLILKATLSTLTQSSSTAFVGDTVSFNATAAGGNGYGYLYKYVIKNGPNTVFTTDYTSTSTLDFIANNPGSYTVEAYIKDKLSISDYDDEKVSFFAVYGVPVINNFSLSKTDILLGQKVTANIDVQSGSGSYLYKYEVTKDGTVISTRDFSIDKQFTYTPDQPGNYSMTAYVKDALSTKAYDFKQSQSFTAFNVLNLTSFIKDDENVFIGDVVNFSTAVEGGSGKGIKYRFVVIKDGEIVFTRDFAADSKFAYTPNAAGNYEVDAYAVDAISDNIYDAADKMSFLVKAKDSLTDLTIDKNAPFPGDTVTFNAAASASDTLYKYIVSKEGIQVFSSEYSANSALQYVPASPGTYQVQVFAKDSVSPADYDDTKSLTFIVYDYPQLSGASADKAQLLKNDTIHLTAGGMKGTNSYLYKFVVSKDNIVVAAQDYSPSSSYDFTPTEEGNYKAAVYLKDALSFKEYDDMKELAFTVLADAKIGTFQIDKTQYLVGQTIYVDATASLGSGSYLYKYVVTKNGEVVAAVDYNSAACMQYKADAEGSYEITVYVKDMLSSKEYDDMSVTTVPVFAQPTMTLTASRNSALVGNTINYSISEANGSGKAQYRFVVIKDSSTVTDSGYVDANTFSFTPTAAGTYQIVGYMKDALSDNTFDAQNTLSLSVYKPQLTNVTVNGYFYEGKTLSFNASSTGSSSFGFNYRYEIYSSKLEASSSYSISGTLSFTPAVPGTYTVKVYGKDGLSTNDYDSIKQFNITISAKPLYLSVLPLSYGMKNNDVVSLQNALVKLGYAISDPPGYFGTKTKNAVTSFQKSKGLSADGIVGNITYKALNDALIEKAGTKTLTY